MISGATAAEISDSVRALIDRGELVPGDALPPVRALAEQLGVNRNTAVAAYRRLARDGAVIGQGRAGTRVAGAAPTPQEGFAPAAALAELAELAEQPEGVPVGDLRDLGTGNPSPALIPDLAPALAGAVGRPVLYGEPVIDPDFARWARAWMAPDVPGGADGPSLTLTSGAVDAIERLLAQALTRDDAVALEDPCFLASIQTVRHAGYRAIPVPVDAAGMTPHGLRAALEDGARAVVLTPRAQNPTGASLGARRAQELGEVLANHPYVLVIQDDYYSFLSRSPFRSVVGPGHRRWALVRSVSKFLGPDLCLAVTATDPETARRLALRLSPGTTWVSHLLQRLAHGVLREDGARELIERAGAHYAARGAAFAEAMARHGLPLVPGDGMSLWVPVPRPARQVATALARRGWLVRTGDEFRLAADGPAGPGVGRSGGPGVEPSHHLRLTVHELTDAQMDALAADLAAACR
ncbi:aminotransferase class I/II-fold pyridoxal phosphate-dependent enzyme [Brachybacterium saurashtrense]|uniref:Aminotransferase class I/II-fold pyridoxal phosphate-dependent enzyme n=1 Tax=Brachybacterium saurashtrense TaxID=556288 RepID=A0A345YRU8_9MICO|nr:aminotransferase class I/II-fold pyridoxal phosphate-dependent enzyme [Brachybacterium saurashtrense]AXK46650.1 aminotransferase class I/II-fold pyridoxal phosphate-dependent enzyme [Brachybacterium saurashtrense]RRR22364.1 aminotransferase class I/II-fold pyridoxal phosphate-dependent enzyme [Brachybacterium saurashtrense]